MPPAATSRARILRLGACAFPVFLLLFATFFLGGQIGFWSDDYWHNQRDPVTQAMPNLWASGHLSLKPLVIAPAADRAALAPGCQQQ